jgi:hypothetical protein
MTTINRKIVRHELAKYLTGFMKSAAKVFPYQVGDFKKMTPVVYITSGGSERNRLTGRGFQSGFDFNVHILVLYADEESKWTEDQAEDLLDTLEFELAEAVISISNHETIKHLAYQGKSNANGTALIGGLTYLHEIVPVSAHCFA